MTESKEVLEARERLRAKLGNVSVRTGGKGTVRRKKRVAKPTVNEDKKVQTTLRRLGVQPIPGIEEVNLFMDDNETVVNFRNPKVQAAVAANTFAISGNHETKGISDMMPGILSQLDQGKLFSSLAQNLKLEKEKNKNKEGNTADEIPELVNDFEEVSEN